MILIHNTKEKELVISNRNQRSDYKPNGLWYGIGNEWLDWCKSEMPDWIYLYNYVLELNMAKILLITNLRQFNQFNNEYSFRPCKEIQSLCYIDWKRVALKYSGIEISPYLGKRRLCRGSSWYYGWDCASGCVWNKEAVLSCIKKEI